MLVKSCAHMDAGSIFDRLFRHMVDTMDDLLFVGV